METQQEQDLSPSMTAHKASAITRRNSKMSSIRSSLQTIPLINKNRNLVATRLRQRKLSFNELDEQEESNAKWQIILNQFSISDLFEEKYKILQKIGEGSSGVVYRCSKRKTGEIFAVKSFKFEDEHVPNLKANFILQKSLNHPSVIRYEAIYLNMKKYLGWLVMEYIEWPSLDSVSMNNQEQIRVIMQRLLEGLSYLHKQNIVHRDIKPQNILYDQSTQLIKIIDFGISRKYKRRGKLFDMWTITGTPYYRAPQMFSGGYRQGVDIWAAGILLCKLVSGYTPFQSIYHSQTITNILEEQLSLSHHFDSMSHELSCFVKRMLTRKVQERPSAQTLLKDVWFYPITQNYGSYVGSLGFIEIEHKSVLNNELNFPLSMKRVSSNRDNTQLGKSVKQIISFEELMSQTSSNNYVTQKDQNYFFIDSKSDKFEKSASSLSPIKTTVRTRRTLPLM